MGAELFWKVWSSTHYDPSCLLLKGRKIGDFLFCPSLLVFSISFSFLTLFSSIHRSLGLWSGTLCPQGYPGKVSRKTISHSIPGLPELTSDTCLPVSGFINQFRDLQVSFWESFSLFFPNHLLLSFLLWTLFLVSTPAWKQKHQFFMWFPVTFLSQIFSTMRLRSWACDPCSLTWSCAQKSPTFSLMLCCCCLEVLNNLRTRILQFHFAQDPTDYVAWSVYDTWPWANLALPWFPLIHQHGLRPCAEGGQTDRDETPTISLLAKMGIIIPTAREGISDTNWGCHGKVRIWELI